MSLRTRLILTHIFVILLTLTIITIGLVVTLRNYQRQVQLSRLGDAVIPLAFQARTLFQNNITPDDVIARLEPQANDIGFLMIINDKGQVLIDATNTLTDRKIELNPLNRPGSPPGFVWGVQTIKVSHRVIVFAAVSAGKYKGQTVYIALAANERPAYALIEDIGSSLAITGIITLFVSLVVALLLARSIAGPIIRLTRATEAIARGQYDHRVKVKGNDEIGRLGSSLNSMAEQVQRSREMEKDFVANVSHELKTPLTSIQGFAQAILDGAVQDLEGAQRAAQTIFDETGRMTRLVGDLLTLARYESGQMALTDESINLTELLPRWIERYQTRAQSLGETLVTNTEQLPPIAGDAGRLEQVISNLMDNALKYNHPGGTVTVTAKMETVARVSTSSKIKLRRISENPEPMWVSIVIADSGAGIPPEDVPRIFERFYRGDRARVAGGTGLGLAIAREIILAHGGHITVKSELGHGSEFTIHIPIRNGIHA